MNEAMNIYETFNKLRYHHENEVVEFKKAENNFDFDDLGKYFSALSNEANLRDKGFAWQGHFYALRDEQEEKLVDDLIYMFRTCEKSSISQKADDLDKNDAYSFDMVSNRGTDVRTQTYILKQKNG